ncbi:MAG: PAS domain-containing protein [Gammaproteobacteria bacterium]
MKYLKTTFAGKKFNNIKLNENSNTNLVTENISHQLLISVINQLPGIVYWKNKEGVYLWHNTFKEEYRQKYQWPSSIAGKTDYDLFPHNVAEECRRHDLETMLSDNGIIRKKIGHSLTGKEYIQLSYKKALKDNQGEIIGIVGNLIDVTSINSKKNQPTSDDCKDNFKNQKNPIYDNLQIYIKKPLKEVLLLINLLSTNEDKNDNLVLISEIKTVIKILFNNFDNILKYDFDVTKRMKICKN